MKYLNKSFSVGMYVNDGWWNREPGEVSKGEWVLMPGQKQRWIPEGKEIPPEATRQGPKP